MEDTLIGHQFLLQDKELKIVQDEMYKFVPSLLFSLIFNAVIILLLARASDPPHTLKEKN